jgi:hypothetical protein
MTRPRPCLPDVSLKRFYFGFPSTGRRFAFGLVAALTLGCSWQRYNDVTEKTPVLMLDTPNGIDDLGVSIATITGKAGTAKVFVAGLNGYALYDLGKKEPTSTDALDEDSCKASDRCFIAESVSAIHRNIDGTNAACFAYAIEQHTDGALRTKLYCDDGTNVALPLDTATETAFGKLSSSSTLQLKYASGPRRNPQRLFATSANHAALWYYPSSTSNTVAIARPNGVGSSFGRSLALMDQRFDATADGATLVIGEPDANRIHLLTVDDSGTLISTTCLEGSTGFGRSMTAGYFVDKNRQGLAVGTDSQVTVLSDLTSLVQASPQGGGCVALDAAPSAKTLSCQDFGLEVNCDNALTLGSITPADLNGDGIDELVVGVPMAMSNGERSAGQLITVSVTSDGLVVRDWFAPSSIESGDRLGQSVVALPLSRPDVVLAGAPGGNKLAAFYCSALLPAGLGGKRCE